MSECDVENGFIYIVEEDVDVFWIMFFKWLFYIIIFVVDCCIKVDFVDNLSIFFWVFCNFYDIIVFDFVDLIYYGFYCVCGVGDYNYFVFFWFVIVEEVKISC